MTLPFVSSKREQSRNEEIASSVIHGIGLISSLVGTPILIDHAVRHGEIVNIVGNSVFTATTILLYLTSTVYHALQKPRLKNLFNLINHLMIYLLIAGTYTPFTLGVLQGTFGWLLFGMIWGLATIGMSLKIFNKFGHPFFSIGMYLFMGWLILIAIEPLYNKVSSLGLIWLFAGAVCYTTGVFFYATDGRIRYGHSIWHVFVLCGTACHFTAVWYAI